MVTMAGHNLYESYWKIKNIIPSSNIITDDISLHLFRPDKGKKNSDERQR
jgi:hypothetical protein